jgi:hypothetical protein
MTSTDTVLNIIGFHILLQLVSTTKRPLLEGDRAGNGGSNFEVVLRVIELSGLGFGRKLFRKDSSTLVNVSSVDPEAGFQRLTLIPLFKPVGHEGERWNVLGYG